MVVVANGLLLRVVNDDATNTRRWAMLRVTADRARRIILFDSAVLGRAAFGLEYVCRRVENEKESDEELLPSSMTRSCPVTDTASRPPFRVTRSDVFQLRDHVGYSVRTPTTSRHVEREPHLVGDAAVLILVGTETIDHCCCKTRTTFTKPRLPSPLGHRHSTKKLQPIPLHTTFFLGHHHHLYNFQCFGRQQK